MLSVHSNPSSHTRSRSRDGGRERGYTHERSRSRDMRAPSPAAVQVSAPSPSVRRSRNAYDSDDSEALEEDSDAYRPSGRERHGRSGSGYEAAAMRKGRGDSFDDDGRRGTGVRGGLYGEVERENGYRRDGEKERPGYERRESDRRIEREREIQRAYEVPGSFSAYEEHSAGRAGTRHMFINPTTEYHRDTPIAGGDKNSSYYGPPSAGLRDERDPALYRTQSGPGYDNRVQYAAPGKYEYARAPSEVKYLSKGQDDRPRYTAKEAAEIEVERRRHRREEEEERQTREIEAELKQRRKVADRDPRRGYRKGESESDSEDEKEKRIRKFDEEERAREREMERERDRRRHIEVEQSKRERRPSHSRPETQVVEITPGGRGGGSSLKPLEHGLRRLSVSGGAAGAMLGAGLVAQHHGHHPSAAPPGSPLLEAYHGTYQSISPMPSPMALPSSMDDGLSDLEPLEPEYGSDEFDHHKPKKSILKKRVEIYDPETDAKAIAAELKHSKPEAKPLIKILPHLSDDNMMALRTEYKKHFKVQGKGINIAKHIKVKYTGNIGKVAYATALGRWESEAHWANFWYQSGSSRRELLIESLMGRSNVEVRQIKEAFSDKRYNDSLEKCMQTELKKDKFRHAVLLALEEKRQDDLAPLSKTRIKEDVKELYEALIATDGGETAMINIIVVRSDVHLREVLREFETKYRRNFAREMIQKSKNLVVSSTHYFLSFRSLSHLGHVFPLVYNKR